MPVITLIGEPSDPIVSPLKSSTREHFAIDPFSSLIALNWYTKYVKLVHFASEDITSLFTTKVVELRVLFLLSIKISSTVDVGFANCNEQVMLSIEPSTYSVFVSIWRPCEESAKWKLVYIVFPFSQKRYIPCNDMVWISIRKWSLESIKEFIVSQRYTLYKHRQVSKRSIKLFHHIKLAFI